MGVRSPVTGRWVGSRGTLSERPGASEALSLSRSQEPPYGQRDCYFLISSRVFTVQESVIRLMSPVAGVGRDLGRVPCRGLGPRPRGEGPPRAESRRGRSGPGGSPTPSAASPIGPL